MTGVVEKQQVLVAEDFADLFGLVAKQREPAVARTLCRMVERHQAAHTSVRMADAARALQISVPTARSWTEKGVLDEVEGGTVRRVSAVSLGWAMSVLRAAATTESGRTKLEQALNSLADRALLLRGRELVEGLGGEELETFSHEELSALRAG